MTATSTGKLAEDAASEYLQNLGYQIVARNWRTRRCEIDIIAKKTEAKKASTIYFVEVKYRASTSQGGGLASITTTKIQQMRYAAEMWLAENGPASAASLAAIEVSGPDFHITSFLDSIT
jgi:uncharacterized protein (TIGR00252 family)